MGESILFRVDEDVSGKRLLVDGFSLLHISYGMVATAALLQIGLDVWPTCGVVLGLAVVWEIVENGWSSVWKPCFGLDPSHTDSYLNIVGDVLIAFAGFGLSVGIGWYANLIVGGCFFVLGVFWAVLRVNRKRSATTFGDTLLG
jgi:hypothetical protein